MKMAVDFKLIGNRIKAVRKNRDITQEMLAEWLSYSTGYISNMERGTTKISLSTLARIADLLDCDIAELVTGSSTGKKTYLDEEFGALLTKLTDDEKRTAYRVLDLYIKEKTD
jgi:transcriptional regulator with XRE-family HTH domain